MRLVFDTNVLVAAVVASGVCRALVEYCTEHHQLVIFGFILGELREKLYRKFKLTSNLVESVLALLIRATREGLGIGQGRAAADSQMRCTSRWGGVVPLEWWAPVIIATQSMG